MTITDVFICVITGRHRVATVRSGETIDRIHAVEFYSLNRSKWDGFGPNHYSQIPGAYDYDADRSVLEGGEFEHPCTQLKKLLSGGSFFFSVDADITNRLQNRCQFPLSKLRVLGRLMHHSTYLQQMTNFYGIPICCPLYFPSEVTSRLKNVHY